MSKTRYLLDTHALIFWSSQEAVSTEFIRFFDHKDRLLIAQANQNSLTLVTRDKLIQKYDVQNFWMK